MTPSFFGLYVAVGRVLCLGKRLQCAVAKCGRCATRKATAVATLDSRGGTSSGRRASLGRRFSGDVMLSFQTNSNSDAFRSARTRMWR
jgi:hypothetical protein